MKYIKFTYVDAITGVSIASHPAENGPVFPAVDGLAFVWARESAYPTPVPEFFGTCPDGAFTMIDGVLDVVSQYDFENMQTDEMRARDKTPKSVTMRQARLALLGAGLLATVSDAVATMAGAEGDAARIEWEFSSEVKRDQPLVIALAPVLGMTDAQLDDLFIAAAAL